jgi:DNA-binding CsgD family transcriptional regulator
MILCVMPLYDTRVVRRSVQLTGAELRVLQRLAGGSTYTEIASDLSLASATVAYHASKLRARFGVTNNVALIAAAIISGLFSAGVWPPELSGVMWVDIDE